MDNLLNITFKQKIILTCLESWSVFVTVYINQMIITVFPNYSSVVKAINATNSNDSTIVKVKAFNNTNCTLSDPSNIYVGLLIGFKYCIELFCIPIVGLICDLFFPPLILFIGLIIQLMSCIIYSISGNYYLTIFSRIIDGIAYSVISTSGLTILFTIYSRDTSRNKIITIDSILVYIAAFGSPFMAGFLFNYKTVYNEDIARQLVFIHILPIIVVLILALSPFAFCDKWLFKKCFKKKILDDDNVSIELINKPNSIKFPGEDVNHINDDKSVKSMLDSPNSDLVAKKDELDIENHKTDVKLLNEDLDVKYSNDFPIESNSNTGHQLEVKIVNMDVKDDTKGVNQVSHDKYLKSSRVNIDDGNDLAKPLNEKEIEIKSDELSEKLIDSNKQLKYSNLSLVKVKQNKTTFLMLLTDKHIWIILINLCLNTLVGNSLETTLSIHMIRKFCSSSKQQGEVWLFGSFSVLGFLISTLVFHKYKRYSWLIPVVSMIFNGSLCISLAFTYNWLQIGIILGLMFNFSSMTEIILIPTVPKLIDKKYSKNYGSGSSLTMVTFTVSGLIGSFPIGPIVEYIGFEIFIIVLGSLLILPAFSNIFLRQYFL